VRKNDLSEDVFQVERFHVFVLHFVLIIDQIENVDE
jgi:hypothetical protein